MIDIGDEKQRLALTLPIHWPTQGQWWSKRSTQLLQMEQWEHLGGLYSMQVWQYLTLMTTPPTMTSLVGGNVPPRFPAQSADIFDVSASSSGSGGCALRGIMPGSLPDVIRRRNRTCMQNYRMIRDAKKK